MQAPIPRIEKIRSVLCSDPKRTGVLGVLAMVMIFLWGRLLFSGPASATASLIRRSVAVITESPVSTAVAPTNAVLDWLGKPRVPVDRNLFSIHLDYYARADDRKAATDGDEDPATAATGEADKKREQQILIENLQTQAAKLKLQTTVMGTTPRAMVNGQLVQAGDSVDGFVVMKIEARVITVQQDGVTLQIEMP
jgi:hypothetical protein